MGGIGASFYTVVNYGEKSSVYRTISIRLWTPGVRARGLAGIFEPGILRNVPGVI